MAVEKLKNEFFLDQFFSHLFNAENEMKKFIQDLKEFKERKM